MKKSFLKFLCAIMALTVALSLFNAVPPLVTEGLTKSEVQAEIDRLNKKQKDINNKIAQLEKDAAKQKELKSAIEEKMALVQKEIAVCTSQIDSINSSIAENKAEINKKNAEIEKDKLEFKKRLRAIYMSSTDSNVQILMGAEDFSQFLQLSQLTASVSARDKLMIEKIVAAIEVLNLKQEENNKLLKEQQAVKANIVAKQNDLKAESNKIEGIISKINSDKGDAEDDKAKNAADLKAMRNELNNFITHSSSNTNQKYDGGAFLWPTPTISKISSYYGERWGTTHEGIDIANGTYGAKVIAIADGVVTRSINHCTHNYRKYSDCCGISGQGRGFGNHVLIDHGRGSNGTTYAAIYAHLTSTAVSAGQHVKKGQTIGYVGCTGYSTGPHLHFGMIVNGRYVDPMRYYRAVK